MFVREKSINGYTYLYLVESVREDGRAKQRIIKNLGRKNAVVASGELDRLASSVARYAERAIVLSQLEASNPDRLACTRIGAPLLFGRLWEETGCRAVIEALLAERRFEFPVKRAVFATVLHRLMVSGSDRACERWLTDYHIPVVDRLRSRFAIGRVCVVADRGMISAATIAAIEERGLEYVLGARERTDSLVRTVVLADTKPFTPLCIERAGGEQTPLFVKEVTVEGRRYVVCRNEAEAAKDAADRRAIVEALDRQLRRGDKALIGNSAYRRYLRTTTDTRAFEIDPGKLADEARYDGVFVLRTNARITPLQAVLRYRDLIQVEALFRTAKALMHTRPIYHQSDAAIRGHVFCSFLALVLRQELDERCRTADLRPEWGDVLRDLDRLQEVAISKGGKTMALRTPATGIVGPLFKAARVALPPNVRDDASTA